ncbi:MULTISPECIES: hypothetical protein [unclassified Mesorhizobium]|uniref:hypothetical protein n=1 Tax=unclassified Mesorhizobium TaxID=325217 RepID=UPI003338BEF5
MNHGSCVAGLSREHAANSDRRGMLWRGPGRRAGMNWPRAQFIWDASASVWLPYSVESVGRMDVADMAAIMRPNGCQPTGSTNI